MAFTLKGYVLEKPRVGAANSPFTLTPDVFIADQGAFDTAYPNTETAPRTDYMVLVEQDGKLPDALFGWTRNESLTVGGPSIQRFDYDGRRQGFVPLPGSAPVAVGVLSATANTTRLKVPVPAGVSVAAPFRLAVGAVGSGTSLTTSLVTAFGSPAAGTVEILTLGANAGELNWNSTDLVTYSGQPVRFQRQSFFTPKESNGRLGVIANNTLLLCPIPGTGQRPLLRIGYGLWLTTVERPDEGSFSADPVAGTVEWAADTGMLKFHTADITANAGRAVYYDGVLMARGVTLPSESLGTVNFAGDTSPQSVLMTVPVPGGDIVFRVPGVTQFEEAVLVTVFDSTGKQGQVQYNVGGQVQLSLADRLAYGGQPLQVVLGDLPIERGVTARFYRTPVDLTGADPSLKDVSSIYNVVGATWAEPIQAMPQVFLPSVPIDDPAYPTTISIAQGTGSFLGALPRQDVVGAPAGYGYVIDFDQKILQFTRRYNNLLLPLLKDAPFVSLPDPLVVDAQLSFELETAPGSNTFTTLVRDVDFLLDAIAGQVYFTTTFGSLRASGSAGSISGTSFTDASNDFITTGVAPGDFLLIRTGAAKGVYTVTAVATSQLTTDVAAAAPGVNAAYEVRSAKEILADRYFQEVQIVDPYTKVERIRSLGVAQNSPRRAVTKDRVNTTRFLFNPSITTTTVVVANDGLFTTPASLAAGTIEISEATGNLNFSQADVTAGTTVSWVFRLTQGSDYRISGPLGLIQFTERMFAGEQAFLTYTSATAPTTVIEERATFLVRKEQSQAHPLPTSIVTFNPTGHEVAATPPPRVFRGGRPQTSVQATVNAAASTVTFNPDGQLTDALPHGSTVNPNERVLIDYYVYDAIGGEETTSVLQPPLNLARVVISQGQPSFEVKGDWTASFPSGHLLRVGADAVHLIGSSAYDSGSDTTTVTLGGGQTFRDDAADPKLYVTSGLTRTATIAFQPSYFVTEMGSYDPIPRGGNVLKVAGDRTASYKSDVVVLFTNGTFSDTYRVSGAKFNAATNRTEVTLTSNVTRQYTTDTLRHSARPIFEATVLTVSTSLNPMLTFPGSTQEQYALFRRVEGQPGVLLSAPVDYEIDPSGVVTFTEALKPNEELSLFYTGLRAVEAGRRIRASFTHVTAPSASNGLQGQVLRADYSTFVPDNCYFRVESLTIFRGETADDFESQATSSAPSGGPSTSNMSTPQLNEQGRESVYFQEGHLANQDTIARSVLKFYNDAVNNLEDALQAMDGRVVGDRHGRFRFDGNLANPVRTNPAQVTNQIDDVLRVSPFPLPDGTVQSVYLPGPYSRFFCTRRNLFGGPTVSATEDGEPIARFAFKNLSSLPGEARRRAQRAHILRDYPAGTTTFEVDNATGTSDALLRPAFINGMRVVLRDAAGTTYINEAANVTVSGTAAGPPETITLSNPVGSAVPAGATIYLSPADASTTLSDGAQNGYAMVYKFGKDVDANMETGELLYISRKFPFDGTLPTAFIPKILLINNVPAGDILQCDGAGLFNTLTEPYKFPALYGKTTDDDGDQAVPMVGPLFTGELSLSGGGALNDERAAIQPVTGTLRTLPEPPYVGTGDLDGTGTIITDAAPYAGTLPQIHDLVRITSGVNAGSTFHHVTAVGANTVTVDPPFTPDTGFTYTISVSSLVVGGAGTFTGTGFTDFVANFTVDAKVGYTVVVTSGIHTGLRRQIVAIPNATDLVLDAALPSDGPANYRIDNPLATYSGPAATALTGALVTELATVGTAQQSALNAFFSTVFTPISTGTGVTSLVDLTKLDDVGADFVTAGVNASHFVFVPSGVNAGVYKVASIDSPTQLTVATAFPGADAAMGYQVVSVFGVGLTTLQDLFGVLTANDTFLTATLAFQSLAAPVSVEGDLAAFARGYLFTDFDARDAVVVARLSYLTDPASGPIVKIENALSGTERLYDKRYTWIDARINLEKGLLIQKTRAIETRIKAQADILKQLTKLLAVRT